MTNTEKQFTEFYNQYEGYVRRIAAHTADNHFDVDDICSRTWITVWRAFEAGKGPWPGKEKGWLGVVTRNEASDYYESVLARRKHEIPVVTLRETDETDDAILARYGADDHSIEHDDPRLELLRRSITRLSPALREVLTLRYVSGLDVDDIAQKLGISPAAVRKRIERGLRTLKAKINVTK